MIIGNKVFKDYTYVMAIINLTPDSFWAGSRAMSDAALSACERAVKEGADVLDLGAQSTRPGYEEVSPEEELARLEKPLSAIVKQFGVPVSVDTYFPEVAKAALEIGADMINDIWGLTRGNMAEVIAKHGASACIMHNSHTQVSGDVVSAVCSFLERRAKVAVAAGISPDKILLDGGIGFAKSREQNLELLNNYAKLKSAGYPLLLGHSRKSLFGGRVEDRLPRTLAATYAAARSGVLFVRVHDVKQNKEEIKKAYENRN